MDLATVRALVGELVSQDSFRQTVKESLCVNDVYLREKEVKSLYSFSPSWLRRKRVEGGSDAPPFYKVDGIVLYKKSELDEWMAAKRRRSTSECK